MKRKQLECLTSTFSNIKKLRVESIGIFTKDFFSIIDHKFSMLKHLQMGRTEKYYTGFFAKELLLFGVHFPFITKLDLYLTGITDDTLSQLISMLASLKKLYIHERKLNGEFLLTEMRKLTKLQLNVATLTNFNELSLPLVEELEIYTRKIDGYMGLAEKCYNLKRIIFSFDSCSDVIFDDFISNFPNVETLDFRCGVMRFNSTVLQSLGKLSHLRNLIYYGSHFKQNKFMTLNDGETNALSELIRRLHWVTNFEFNFSNISNKECFDNFVSDAKIIKCHRPYLSIKILKRGKMRDRSENSYCNGPWIIDVQK
ncbi:hypothetical protein B4U80_13608 [Leptotrombidium deliense]|uniref:Uncharacterized protein n=1 Tax=Leptotrombidium deliense TaxID=299467 RepID=A0A443SU52_9ACAR|nr:hypothetical protein B4U80_13608 [Leptotrombidium deliense]